MPGERYYTQVLEHLKGPRLTQDLVRVAQRLFDSASGDGELFEGLPPPSSFQDSVSASRAYWEWHADDSLEYERFAVNISDGGLNIALEHRHMDDSPLLFNSENSFIDHRRTVLVLGSQRPAIWSGEMGDVGKRRDALRGRETVLPAFRTRLDHTLHTMAAVSLEELREAS